MIRDYDLPNLAPPNFSAEPMTPATREARPAPNLNTRLALRQKQAAVALGISERKLREITPRLTTVWIGRVRLYPVEALRNWLIEEAERQAEAVKNRNQTVKQSLRRVPDPGA